MHTKNAVGGFPILRSIFVGPWVSSSGLVSMPMWRKRDRLWRNPTATWVGRQGRNGMLVVPLVIQQRNEGGYPPGVNRGAALETRRTKWRLSSLRKSSKDRWISQQTMNKLSTYGHNIHVAHCCLLHYISCLLH